MFLLFGLRGTAHTNAAAKIFTPAQVPLFATFSGAAVAARAVQPLYLSRAFELCRRDRCGLQAAEPSSSSTASACSTRTTATARKARPRRRRRSKKYNLAISAVGTVEPNSSDVTARRGRDREDPAAGDRDVRELQGERGIRARACASRSSYAQYMNLSIVGATALAKELGNDARGIGVSQVVPFPGTPASPSSRNTRR